jgi:hypothetical protein
MPHLSLYFRHIIFETTAQIPESEFGGKIRIFEAKYRYVMANTDFGRRAIANTDS